MAFFGAIAVCATQAIAMEWGQAASVDPAMGRAFFETQLEIRECTRPENVRWEPIETVATYIDTRGTLWLVIRIQYGVGAQGYILRTRKAEGIWI